MYSYGCLVMSPIAASADTNRGALIGKVTPPHSSLPWVKASVGGASGSAAALITTMLWA
jgi:hypothetical protein